MIYDGIVVDIPLAHFFLNSLLGRRNSLDELASLDAELARNLAFVRNYDGDMEDLGLVFAVDDDILGKVVTTPLRFGGSACDVTSENVILYTHLVADYRLNKQTSKQVSALLQGMHAFIKPHWLYPFTAPELQRLLAGDNVPLDVADLKQHVVYAGGFHAAHRVVRWLWEVVDKDLSSQEQELFLKFVTSCSKPPVLGFAHLQPAFTVRAFHEGAAEESYTVGSALRNFFSSGQDTSRLPTSSTCFNMLKYDPDAIASLFYLALALLSSWLSYFSSCPLFD